MSVSTEAVKLILILGILGVLTYFAQQYWVSDIINCHNDIICNVGNWAITLLAGGMVALVGSGVLLSVTVFGGMPFQAQSTVGKTTGSFNFFLAAALTLILLLPSFALVNRVFNFFPWFIYFIIVLGYLIGYTIRKSRGM